VNWLGNSLPSSIGHSLKRVVAWMPMDGSPDEGRFGRISVPRRAWAPPGIQPRSPQQVVREYIYVYAALAPEVGKMTSLILPTASRSSGLCSSSSLSVQAARWRTDLVAIDGRAALLRGKPYYAH
jgi:hypothetical protein